MNDSCGVWLSCSCSTCHHRENLAEWKDDVLEFRKRIHGEYHTLRLSIKPFLAALQSSSNVVVDG